MVVTNNLTIRGIGEGRAVLRPSALPFDPGGPINGSPRKAILVVNEARGVTIASLTVDGSAIDTKNALCPGLFVGVNVGIYYRNSSGTVASAHATNVKSAVRCSAGILAESGVSGGAKVDIMRNTVDENGGAGVVCIGANTNCAVAANTIVGPAFIAGIIVEAKAVGRITDNIVYGFVCNLPFCGPDPINQGQSSGILLDIAGSGNSVSENLVFENDVGILQILSSDCCTISENKLRDNRFFGVIIQDGNGTTSENEIRGGLVGIGVVADSADTVGVLRDDEIKGASVAPVREIACCGFSAKAIVQKD